VDRVNGIHLKPYYQPAENTQAKYNSTEELQADNHKEEESFFCSESESVDSLLLEGTSPSDSTPSKKNKVGRKNCMCMCSYL